MCKVELVKLGPGGLRKFKKNKLGLSCANLKTEWYFFTDLTDISVYIFFVGVTNIYACS